MNNIGYLLSGYDIFYGNPVPSFDNELVDPGFRQPVFTAEYKGDMSQDYRYCIPDGLTILKCVGNCDLSFSTDIIYGTYSYEEKLSGSVGINGNVDGIGGKVNASFGASIGFHNVKKLTEGSAHSLTQAEASCCAYQAEMFEFIKPKFNRNFIAGLSTLTEEFNPTVYYRFIKAFGTHYVQQSTMGAIFGQQSTFDKDSWSTYLENGWDITLGATASAIAAMASFNATLGYNKTEAESFMRAATDQKTYSRGNPPPEDGQALTWAQLTIDNPNVLTIKLEALDTLPLEEYVSAKVIDNLGKALEEYCPKLLEDGAIESCDAPPPDPPAPKPRTWTHWSNFQTGSDYKVQVSSWQIIECHSFNVWQYL